MLLEIAQAEGAAFYPFLAFLLYTGCRKGEARALKWQDVDWHAPRLLIRRSYSRDRLLSLPRFRGHPGSHESAVGVCHGEPEEASVFS